MRIRHVVSIGVVSALLALTYLQSARVPVAEAQGVGIYMRADCATISSPVAGQTWCFDSTLNTLKAYNGSVFATATGANFATATSIPGAGQSNFINVPFVASPTGTSQQIGAAFAIVGADAALLPAGSFRIAGYFGAETRAGGEAILPLNVSVISRAGDAPSTSNAIQVGLSNNQASASLLNCIQPCYNGISVVSTGGKAASYALSIGGTGQWMQGYEVEQGAIATGGYAINYKGNGVQGPFTVDALSSATANTLNAASATYSNNVAVIVASGTTSNLTSIRGLSASSSKSNNLRGTCTFAAAATCAVTFANNEPDSNYFIMVGGIVNVSARAVSGFTMTATGSNSNAVDWMLVR